MDGLKSINLAKSFLRFGLQLNYMKKISIIILALVIIPSIALASWWNPFTWFNNKTTVVPQVNVATQSANSTITTKDDSKIEIEALQKQINDLKNQNLNSNLTKAIPSKKENNTTKTTPVVSSGGGGSYTPTPTPVVTPPAEIVTPKIVDSTPERKFRFDNGKLDLGGYNELTALNYMKNRKASFNKPVQIKNGVIDAFNQGSKNFIEIEDINDTSSVPGVIEVLVPNDSDYTYITNELGKWDKVLIYGYGTSDTKFNIIGNGGSYESYQPTIVLDAIYKCTKSSECRYPYNVGVEQVFSIKK